MCCYVFAIALEPRSVPVVVPASWAAEPMEGFIGGLRGSLDGSDGFVGGYVPALNNCMKNFEIILQSLTEILQDKFKEIIEQIFLVERFWCIITEIDRTTNESTNGKCHLQMVNDIKANSRPKRTLVLSGLSAQIPLCGWKGSCTYYVKWVNDKSIVSYRMVMLKRSSKHIPYISGFIRFFPCVFVYFLVFCGVLPYFLDERDSA